MPTRVRGAHQGLVRKVRAVVGEDVKPRLGGEGDRVESRAGEVNPRGDSRVNVDRVKMPLGLVTLRGEIVRRPGVGTESGDLSNLPLAVGHHTHGGRRGVVVEGNVVKPFIIHKFNVLLGTRDQQKLGLQGNKE